MLITGREAARWLSDLGLCERQARRVLECGLAGRPTRTTASLLFDAERVGALRAWPTLTGPEVSARCPDGLFVGRRSVAVDDDWAEQVSALQDGWGLSVLTEAWVHVRAQRPARLPLVATVGGFVVVAASITAARGGRLSLAAPGPAARGLMGCRVPTGRGRAWVLHDGPWSRGVVGGSRP